MIKKLFLTLTFCLLLSCCDKGLGQFNEWLVGTWNFNDKTEYIYFMEDDVFIMNDSIQGHYEVSDEGDTNIFYYYISQSGNTEGYGYMEFINRKKYESTVVNLPMHEGDTLKIYKK